MSHKSPKSRRSLERDSSDEEGKQKGRYNLRSHHRSYEDDSDEAHEDEYAYEDDSLYSDQSSPSSKSFHDSRVNNSRSSFYQNLDDSLSTSKDSKQSPQKNIYPDLSKICNSPYSSFSSSSCSPVRESADIYGKTEMRQRRSPHDRDFYKENDDKLLGMSHKNRTWKDILPILIFAFMILIIGLVVVSLLGPSEQDTVGSSEQSPFETFIADIHSLEEQLPRQQSRLWRTVKASARHILNDTESDYPSVILLASQTTDAQVASCVAEKISATFERSLDSVTKQAAKVDVHSFRSFNADAQKKKLDEALHQMLDTNGRRSVVVENLQALDPLASLLLHGYCDNDNAPHKDVMIVFTLLIDPGSVNIEDATANDVESFLEKLWGRELDVDKIGALLSRVANNIGVVQAEDVSQIRQLC